jgi:hypothetical protein
MAVTPRDLSITAAVALGGGSLLSGGILGVTLWGMRQSFVLGLAEMRAFLAALVAVFVASSILAFLAVRFWQLAPASRWLVSGVSVASALVASFLALWLSVYWLFAFYFAVAACLLAFAQRIWSRSHA